MTENDFKERKAAALEKAAPHFADPSRFGLPRMTTDETAALIARSAADASRKTVAALEKAALTKLKGMFASMGVASLDDIL